MKKTAINIFLFAFLFFTFRAMPVIAVAAPRLTLTPINGSYTNGSEFKVSIGVNSDGEKSSAVDVWSTFDNSKLEIVSIVKSANPPFAFEISPDFDNKTGNFKFSCVSTNPSGLDDVAINGELAVVTFRAKETGTAFLKFTCSNGSTTDSNIFNSDVNDVISCASNSVGSYTITAGSSSTTTNPTSTPTPTVVTTVAKTTTLPQTGAVGSTIGLIVFGAISLASAVFLKFL